MNGKLESDAALKSQLDAVLAGVAGSQGNQAWYTKLSAFFSEVKAGIPAKLHDMDFLKRLWDSDAVSATGMGSVKIAPALEDSGFRQWFAAEVSKPLPADATDAEAQLTALHDGLRDRLRVLCKRTPRLKLNRVLCAIYPEHFTTVADHGKLMFLHKEMGGSAKDHPVRAHKAIRSRVDIVLGPVITGNSIDTVRRICLPWMVYERIADDSTGEPTSLDPTEETTALKPQPATLRRKGLTSIRGGFQTLLGYLPELSDGVSREEFADIIKQSNPDLAPASLTTCINVVSREFDLCRREGDTYRLSARGINLLETQDPDELADHLLTKVLGVDHVVKTLSRGPQTKANMVAMLQRVHPGWTSDFAPSSMLGWLSSLDVIDASDRKNIVLTERGERWAELVGWEPQSLPSAADASEVVKAEVAAETLVPPFTQLWDRLSSLVAGRLVFQKSLVSQLHAGLWFHSIRHFAVLTGISGSGKTQLAQNYALALCDDAQGDHDRVRVIPVQPGWYDPSPLLGYVNPIQDSSYRSAPFLELLLRASADPEHPYVAILDEMNLSHPEQYLAPVLSAMETHGWLDLHQLGDDGTPIPRRVRYPSNLAIIGTLNMDETTHGLSDKVLDRAYTLEFWDISVQDFPGWSSVQLDPALKEQTQEILTELVKALTPVRLHFGWRTISDVCTYLAFHNSIAGADPTALDNVIYAKVLPKLRGETSVKFQRALQETHKIFADNGLLRCCDKIKSLQEDLVATGSARFWR